MKLTLEEMRESYNRHMKTHYANGYIEIFVDAFNCFMDTIEAQQQEIQQLQSRNAAYWEALAQFKHDYEQGANMSGNYLDVCKLLREATTEYHNPDDVEALAKAEDALRDISNYLYDLMPVGELSCEEADFIWKLNTGKEIADKALAAIDKGIGGGQNGTDNRSSEPNENQSGT